MTSIAVSVGSIGLIHIVVSIVGKHDRRVMDVGQVPLSTRTPAVHAEIVVGIGRTDILGELVLFALCIGGKGDGIGIDDAVCHKRIGANIVGGILGQSGYRLSELTASDVKGEVGNGWLSVSAEAEALLGHIGQRAADSRCDIGGGVCNLRNDRCSHGDVSSIAGPRVILAVFTGYHEQDSQQCQ